MSNIKKNSIKYWLGKLHLWLGLTSGLVVFIIAITGCLYAFQVEIQDLLQPYRFVKPQTQAFLPPSKHKEIAQSLLPGKHIHAVLYTGRDRAVQVIFFSFDPEYYDIVYLNPYTAEVLHITDMEADFFHFILDGHSYLWLPPGIGQPIAASFTLVFVVMLITGIILWWPKKRKHVEQRVKIKWSGKWRRKNYDLHNVLGFYTFSIALILALTGLVWGFQWFANGIYAATGGEKELVYGDPASDTSISYDSDIPAIDKVFEIMKREYPNAATLEVHIPASPEFAIAANANPDSKTYWQTDYQYFDQYTLEEVSVDHIFGRLNESKAADKLMRMNYDIHTGAILGLPGKFLAFFASLICASLPITGLCIWYGRKYKSEVKLRKQRALVNLKMQ